MYQNRQFIFTMSCLSCVQRSKSDIITTEKSFRLGSYLTYAPVVVIDWQVANRFLHCKSFPLMPACGFMSLHALQRRARLLLDLPRCAAQ